MRTVLELPAHYDFAGTLAPLCLGRADPAARLSHTELWWAVRTPDGPATLHLRRNGDTAEATGYGAGAGWVIEAADAIAGLHDDVRGFATLADRHPVVRRAWHDRPGLRMTRTGRLFTHLLPTVLAQKVSGKEAFRSYAKIVRHFGEPAPGPLDGLLLPPDPARIAASPYWVFHPLGVEQKRADTLRRVAAVADRLEAAPDPATATARLTCLPGVGDWTAAEAVRPAYGDPDAVTVGDYNIPHHVGYALTGAARAGSRESAPGRISEADARMLELLEPFAGQRARVVQLLMAATPAPPRFGPRMPLRSFARF
ncbi:3-methyladenine DNA glycosylase [Rugosimonospora acidiphila]|uniref:3-methyladenine DNA glycosylase n=1 Tax=Rugosimonospora acidiphila TaxID=556531 RepID=A0ABP9RMI7_9ACTN